MRRRTLVAYLGLAACMPLALLTTPYGLTIADYYRSVLDNPVLTARVGEWHAATFGGPSTQFVIVLLAAIGLLGFAYGRGFRPPLFMVGLTFALAVAGIHAVRYQVWFGFAATLLIAEVMSGTFASSESPLIRRISARVVPVAAVIGVAGQLAAAGHHRHVAVRGAVAASRHGRDRDLGGRPSAGKDHGW